MTAKRWLIFATPVVVCVAFIWSYLARPTLPVVAFKEYRRIGSFNLPVFSVANPANSDYFRSGATKYEVLVNGVWQQTVTESSVFEHSFTPLPSHQSVEIITAPHIPANASEFRVGFAVKTGDPCHVSVIAQIAARLGIPTNDLTSREIWSASQSRPSASSAPNESPSSPPSR